MHLLDPLDLQAPDLLDVEPIQSTLSSRAFSTMPMTSGITNFTPHVEVSTHDVSIFSFIPQAKSRNPLDNIAVSRRQALRRSASIHRGAEL